MSNNGQFHNFYENWGILFYGVVNAVGNAVPLAWSTFYGIKYAVSLANMGNMISSQHKLSLVYERDNGFKMFFDDLASRIWGVEILILKAAVAYLIPVIFSVLLCVGVYNRRPRLVMVFFVYGVVVTTLSALSSVIVICATWNNSPLPGILRLLACMNHLDVLDPPGLSQSDGKSLVTLDRVTDLWILWAVYLNYVKLGEEAMFKDHIPLVEKPQIKPESPQLIG